MEEAAFRGLKPLACCSNSSPLVVREPADGASGPVAEVGCSQSEVGGASAKAAQLGDEVEDLSSFFSVEIGLCVCLRSWLAFSPDGATTITKGTHTHTHQKNLGFFPEDQDAEF